MYSLNVKNEVSPRMQRFKRRMPAVNQKILSRLSYLAKMKAKNEYLTGGALKQRTKRLYNSIRYDLKRGMSRIYANCFYAPILAKGGQIISDKPMFIPLADNIKPGTPNLKFGIDFIFSSHVNIPSRPFLKPALVKVVRSQELQKIGKWMIPLQWENAA